MLGFYDGFLGFEGVFYRSGLRSFSVGQALQQAWFRKIITNHMDSIHLGVIIVYPMFRAIINHPHLPKLHIVLAVVALHDHMLGGHNGNMNTNSTHYNFADINM